MEHSYSIDKNSLLYKTLEFNEKYLLGGGGGNEAPSSSNKKSEPPANSGGNEPSNAAGNDNENENKSKSKLPNFEERAEARRKFFAVIMKIFGAVLYILYLPLIPWIKITQSVFNNMGDIFSGTLMPL